MTWSIRIRMPAQPGRSPLPRAARTCATNASCNRRSSPSSGWEEMTNSDPSRAATGWPPTDASTSTPAPCSAIHGARMNTARTGPPSMSGNSRSSSKECSWRPKALRSATMSMSPRCARSSMISPAHVPMMGRPAAWNSRSGSASPSRSIPSVIVVDSPPGITSPSMPSRSAGVRTSRTSAPSSRRTLACAAKPPWSARTPTTTGSVTTCAVALPAAPGQQLRLVELARLEALHRGAKALRGLRDARGVAEVRRRLDDRGCARRRVVGLEDARADEDGLGAELHDERRVGRGRDAAGAEERDRQLAVAGDLAHEVVRGLQRLGGPEQLGLVERRQAADLAGDRAQVADRLDDVAGARLALRADHRRALGDAPQRLAEVRRAAHERDAERPLVDVVGLVGRREDLGLVDVVDLERLEHLRLGEVADARLGHDRDGHGLLDALDHEWVAHAGDAAVAADVGRDALERHHGGCAGVLGDLRLVGVDHVHDHAALEHLCQAGLDAECGFVTHAKPDDSGRIYFSRNALIRSAYCSASRLYTPYANAWIIASSAVCERT